MKTFETEKHSIPEGATHYRDGDTGNYFAWYKRVDGFKYRWVPSYIECWDAMDDRGDFNDNYIRPIPQTNIETPEEKEALDLIDTTPHQYEMSKFSGKAEWKNGDECVWGGIEAVFIGYSQSHKSRCAIEYLRDHCSVIDTVFIDALSKPETPQQREERERLEAAYDLYLAFWSASKSSIILESFKEFSWGGNSDLKHFLAIVDKTNYRKESN